MKITISFGYFKKHKGKVSDRKIVKFRGIINKSFIFLKLTNLYYKIRLNR